MLFTFGHMPGIFNFHARADRLRGLFRASLWALAILVSAAHIAAAQDIPLTLHAAEDIALDREPGQAAMLARAEAFDEVHGFLPGRRGGEKLRFLVKGLCGSGRCRVGRARRAASRDKGDG